MKVGVVPEFRGEYYWLSNYFTARFKWRNICFTSAEQAFAYAKTFYALELTEAEHFADLIFRAETPGDAKKLGRRVPINIEEWDKQKVWMMREIVHAKFLHNESEHDLIGKLINTGVMMLVEGNDWGDKFWGRCLDKTTGKMVGFNTLGVILMEERGHWLKGVPPW